ncbi:MULTISPECIES: ChrR family anti-sigma-E factor [Shewanella]|uniref:Transcriptional regulator n=1 Tax=Shewanella marisflavi TaxID=260364 RepID=A0AAC9TYK6_9GAMM|nr:MULTISPECIES: ChrR family anti-sigma-E factor [Shewanella]ASJ97245.1 transcriptional regulator [Shewanella marisflavi]MCL1043514.1 ChrR family anti-sigma-E factor [Shewanella marisflavi]QDF75784.1 transcriptional regulator [Shewanella marisflavi]
MINYHPNSDVLAQFVAGTLPASVSVVVASHVELCDQCKLAVQALTEQAAIDVFGEMTDGVTDATEQTQAIEALFDDLDNSLGFEDSLGVSNLNSSTTVDEFDDCIAAITAQESDDTRQLPQTVTEIAVAGQRIPLPGALKSIALKEWQGLGKLSRSRLALDDGELRMSLLHIDKGGSVPCHTHKGFEITLLLQGSFSDEMGEYHRGDFIWLDGEHTHQPVTQEGCVCLTVSSDAIHFTQGMSQLLNPIGRFIY